MPIESKLLTVENVKAAYEKTGLIPKQRVYFTPASPTHDACGCALGALCYYYGLEIHSDLEAREFFKAHGEVISKEEINEFIEGFDWSCLSDVSHSEWFALGRECAKAVGLP